MNKKILKKLQVLKIEKRVPSVFFDKPQFFRKCLEELKLRKIIEYVPGNRKNSWYYRLLDENRLDTYIETFNIVPENMDKVQAAEFTGDAHNADDNRYPSVPVRVFSEQITFTIDSMPLDGFTVTKNGGALYLPFNEQTALPISGPHLFCFVENQRVFWEVEMVVPDTGCVFFMSGSFSSVLAQNIADTLSSGKFLFLGDYDLAGLIFYLRLKKFFPGVQFYIPDNIEELFLKFGNKSDLTRQSDFFSSILSSEEKDVVFLRNLFEKTGRTLHQEALLINI
jgi:hypothetical protein